MGWTGRNPSLYDFVVNLRHLSLERACHLVSAMVEAGGFDFSPQQQAALQDFVLATRVRAALARDPMSTNIEVEVQSARGEVTIKGDLCDEAEDVQRVAAAVPAVNSVTVQEPEPALAALASPS